MSIRYREKTVKIVDKVCCDLCGSPTTNEYAEITASFDGGFNLQVCETCFRYLLGWMKDRRNPSIFTKENDPLVGKSGNNWHIKFR